MPELYGTLTIDQIKDIFFCDVELNDEYYIRQAFEALVTKIKELENRINELENTNQEKLK